MKKENVSKIIDFFVNYLMGEGPEPTLSMIEEISMYIDQLESRNEDLVKVCEMQRNELKNMLNIVERRRNRGSVQNGNGAQG